MLRPRSCRLLALACQHVACKADSRAGTLACKHKSRLTPARCCAPMHHAITCCHSISHIRHIDQGKHPNVHQLRHATMHMQCAVCRRLYHGACLRPPMPPAPSLPTDAWFCRRCIKKGRARVAREKAGLPVAPARRVSASGAASASAAAAAAAGKATKAAIGGQAPALPLGPKAGKAGKGVGGKRKAGKGGVAGPAAKRGSSLGATSASGAAGEQEGEQGEEGSEYSDVECCVCGQGDRPDILVLVGVSRGCERCDLLPWLCMSLMSLHIRAVKYMS